MTNNPRKLQDLEDYGIEVIERVPIEMPPHPENFRYLWTKQQKLGHWLNLSPDGVVAVAQEAQGGSNGVVRDVADQDGVLSGHADGTHEPGRLALEG